MVKPQLLEEQPLTLAEAKGELEKVQKRDEELSFRAGKCVDYLNDFVHISASQAQDLLKKLEELDISRLKHNHMINIVDLLPKTLDEVKTIFSSSAVSVSKKDMERIVALVKEFTN